MESKDSKQSPSQDRYKVWGLVLIWLITLAFLYIIFWKTTTGLNLN